MSTPPPTRVQKGTFAFLFAAAAFLFLWTLSPVWVPVFLGVLLAVVASPLHGRLVRRLPRHPRLLAAAITAATLALGAALVAFVGFVVVRELVRFLAGGGAEEQARRVLEWLHARRMRGLLARFGESPDQVVAQARASAAQLSTHLSAALSSLVAVTSHGVLTLALTAVTSYYLLLEGRGLLGFLQRLVPLPPEEIRALVHEFREASVAILYGMGAIGGFQALTAGLGFALFGVPKAVVWAALTGVTSLVPAVGTGLTCVPLVAWLALAGHPWRACGLFLWWLLVVVFVADYWLRPQVMEGRMRMHSLLVLISLFGGLEAFGPLGLALGPLGCALFVALLRIYERDYRPRSFTPDAA